MSTTTADTAEAAPSAATSPMVRRLLLAMLPAFALLLGAMSPSLGAEQPPSQVEVSLSPVDLAAEDTIQTLTVKVENSSRTAMRDTEITLRGPAGWTTSPESIQVKGTIRPGTSVTRVVEVRVPTLRDGFRAYEFSADVTYAGGDGLGAATGERVQTSGEILESFADARDNVGTTDLAGVAAGNFDGDGNSFSDEALVEQGVVPGASIEGAGATFTWPDLGPAEEDNATGRGQAFALEGSGSSLALLASGSSLSASGAVTVFYEDGGTSTGYIAVPNWTGVGAGEDTAEQVVGT